MPEMSVEFEVYCATCGAGLCNDTTVEPAGYYSYVKVQVRACENCVDQSYDKGHEAGWEAAQKAARAELAKLKEE